MVKRAFHLANFSKTSITTLQCISASGSVLPPAVYFPGKSLNPEYCLGFPRNVFLGFSDNGWMDTHQFYAWITNHFVHQIPPKRPVVLLLDGHLSHIDYNTTLFCKDNQILLFRLPPHTSHVMQPADRAFDKTARPDVVKASFKCSGIWPVNRHAIDPSMFAPSKMFEAGRSESEIPTDGAGVIAATAEPTAEPCAVSSEPPVATSTPVKAKADDRHTVLKSLEQLESIAGAQRVRLFEKRLQEGYDVADDSVFMAWKILKMKKNAIEKEMCEATIPISHLDEDLCPIICKILTYPEIEKKEGKKKKKKNKSPEAHDVRFSFANFGVAGCRKAKKRK
eukprot:gene14572-16075_t